VIILLPMRWYYVSHPTWTLATVLFLYFVVVLMVNWRTRDWRFLCTLLFSLLYARHGSSWNFFYVEMAIKYRNMELSAFTGKAQNAIRSDAVLFRCKVGRLTGLERPEILDSVREEFEMPDPADRRVKGEGRSGPRLPCQAEVSFSARSNK